MSERGGLWSPLFNPTIYEIFHHLIGARRWLRQFARDVIRADANDRVLDIGCGPGALLHYLPDTTAYIGFDRNPAYIEKARQTHRGRGEFICDDLANVASYALPRVDVVVAIGLLHHLDDDLASGLLRVIARVLNPSGRLITADPCFHVDQGYLQRFFMSLDRGMHVRPFEQYVALCSTVFPDPKAALEQGYFPFPHSVCIMQTATPAEPT